MPLSGETLSLLSAKGMSKASPIMLRAYKKESELEVWKQTASGEYALLKTYPMCRWSGQLGPKKREGDRQVPEGFYTITRSQLNPNSNFYLSFNIGYPNALDRSFGRTGAAIMVHGACTSMGCFSMTDEQMADIYALMREAFDGGQQSVQMQALPFRMTADNLARYRADANFSFWRNLKEGVDHFDVTKQPPRVAACGKRYIFNPQGGEFSPGEACPPFSVDPEVANAVALKNKRDLAAVAALIRAGQPAVKRVYGDGDQHDVFAARGISSRNGKVSQPDQLAAGPRDVPVDPAVQAKADAQILAFAAQEPKLAAPAVEAAPPVVPEAAAAAPSPDQTGVIAAEPPIAPQAPTAADATPMPEALREPVPTSAPIDLSKIY